jgi:hypothetical protein
MACSEGGAELGQQHRRRLPQRIDVAPVRADHHLDPPRRPIHDGGPRKALPGEQVRANPLANQTFANPAPHGAREVPRPPVRLRALANGRVREAVLAPDPAPGDKSDRLRGVGQALISLARTRARGANHGAAARSLRCPKADKIKPAWQSHGGPGTPWPGHARVYISRDDGWKKSTNTSSYSSWPREVGER